MTEVDFLIGKITGAYPISAITSLNVATLRKTKGFLLLLTPK